MKEQKNASPLRELWRFVKFAVISASAGLIETGVFYLLWCIPAAGYWVCYLPALVASVVWNFTLNRRFTFQSAANIPVAMVKVLAYYLVFTPLSTILGNWLVEVRFAGSVLAENLVYWGTLLVNFSTEYLYQRFFVFAHQLDNREKKANSGIDKDHPA